MQNVCFASLSLESNSFFPIRCHRFMLHSLEKAFREIKNWKHLNGKFQSENCVCVHQWNSINIYSILFLFSSIDKMCCDFNWIQETFLLFVAMIAIQKKSEFKRKKWDQIFAKNFHSIKFSLKKMFIFSTGRLMQGQFIPWSNFSNIRMKFVRLKRHRAVYLQPSNRCV